MKVVLPAVLGLRVHVYGSDAEVAGVFAGWGNARTAVLGAIDGVGGHPTFGVGESGAD